MASPRSLVGSLPGRSSLSPAARAGAVLPWWVPALSGAAALIHAAVIRPHLSESRLFAGAFSLMVAVQGGWMAAAALRGDRWVAAVGAGFNGAVVLVWILSRTTGLPVGPEPLTPEPVTALDAAATLCELGVVAGSLARLAIRAGPDLPARTPVLPGLLRLGAVTVVAGFLATLVPAGSESHGAAGHACCTLGGLGPLAALAGAGLGAAALVGLGVRSGRPGRGAEERRTR